MRGMYRSLRRRARGQAGFTLVELLTVVIILGTLAAVSVPIYLNVRKAAWNSMTLSDAKNASLAIETESAEEGGRLPTSFELAANSRGGRVYTLKSFTWGVDTGNKATNSQVTVSQDVSLCYTPGTAFVDKHGNKLPFGPPGNEGSGVTNTLNYRIYATNSNNLDVYYLYDSATGSLTQEDNPDHVPASVSDSEGGYWAPSSGPSKGKYTNPYGVITYCDIELHYHLYGN